MQSTLRLRDTCVRLRLRPGAELACCEGTLWVTFEADRSALASPDLVLTAGQRHRVSVKATYFLSSLHGAAATTCVVDRSREEQGALGRALQRLPLGLQALAARMFMVLACLLCVPMPGLAFELGSATLLKVAELALPPDAPPALVRFMFHQHRIGHAGLLRTYGR